MHALSWPSGGEIDIFEGVNLQSTNQVAVHSVAGCYANTTSLTQTGELTFGNCDYTVEANRGCTYVDPRNASYGAEFAAGGGGVFAAQLASEGISVWFFPVRKAHSLSSPEAGKVQGQARLTFFPSLPQRAQVPSDLASNSSSPDPSTWGLPVAYYPESSCAINQFFAPQQLTLNIALCGDCPSFLSSLLSTASSSPFFSLDQGPASQASFPPLAAPAPAPTTSSTPPTSRPRTSRSPPSGSTTTRRLTRGERERRWRRRAGLSARWARPRRGRAGRRGGGRQKRAV